MKKKILLICMLVSLAVLTLLGCGVGLAAPEGISYDGAMIRWTAVEGAEKYLVRVDGGDEMETTANSFPYQGEGVLTVTVTAVKGKRSEAATITFTQLDTVTEIGVNDDGSLFWEPVPGAGGYKVRIGGKTEIDVGVPAYDGLKPGSNSVQVRAVVPGSKAHYSLWSKAKSVMKLETPKGLTYDGEYFNFFGVTGASEYKLTVNGNEHTTNATTLRYVAGHTSFEASVMAVGNHTVTYDSAPSAMQRFVYLDTVTDLRVEDGVVRWSAIDEATGYRLKLDGIVQSRVLTEPAYRPAAGLSTTISIMPVCDNAQYFSDYCAATSVYILPAPVPQWNNDLALDGEANNNVTWDGINKAAGYAVRLTKDGKPTVRSFPDTQRAYAEAYLETGEYTVEVKALAETGSGEYDSQYGAPIRVIRLAAPTAASQNFIVSDPKDLQAGFTVNYRTVTGASHYAIYREGAELDGLRSASDQIRVTSVVDAAMSDEQQFRYTIRSKGGFRIVSGIQTATLDSLSSTSLSFTITVLGVPAQPSMAGFSLTYGSVSGANGYILDTGGQTFTAAGTIYSLAALEAGEHPVRVCAGGNGSSVLASNYTAAITVKRLKAPTDIAIRVEGAQEGALSWAPVSEAKSYQVYLDDAAAALPAESYDNIHRFISTEGTTLHMVAVANYYNGDGTVYYMTSASSQTQRFVKLAAPTFPDMHFTDTQLLWNAPLNINAFEYAPFYEVYNGSDILYNGTKNGTAMDLTTLAGGKSYEFYIKAIGNGTLYINSDSSDKVQIFKLAAPTVTRTSDSYVWNGVGSAVSYTVYVDDMLKATRRHEAGASYAYKPGFDKIKTYSVCVYAMGDGGITTIRSDAAEFAQTTAQLPTPTFTYAYSADAYTPDGYVTIRITSGITNVSGFAYYVGGVPAESVDTSVDIEIHNTGIFKLSVVARGGLFDSDGVYYVDSQSAGGDSAHTLVLLGAPNADSVKMNTDGYITWGSVSGSSGYEYCIAYDGGEYGEPRKATGAAVSADGGHSSITIRLRAVGNGTNIVTSAWVEKTWTM